MDREDARGLRNDLAESPAFAWMAQFVQLGRKSNNNFKWPHEKSIFDNEKSFFDK